MVVCQSSQALSRRSGIAFEAAGDVANSRRTLVFEKRGDDEFMQAGMVHDGKSRGRLDLDEIWQGSLYYSLLSNEPQVELVPRTGNYPIACVVRARLLRIVWRAENRDTVRVATLHYVARTVWRHEYSNAQLSP